VPARAHTSSPLHLLGDALWIGGFAASLVWLFAGAPRASRSGQGILLELRPGVQQQALYRRGVRVGSVALLTRRLPRGWQLERRLRLGDDEVALVQQELRADLGMARLSLTARLDRLAEIPELALPLLRALGRAGTVSVSGPCSLETGSCALAGRVGERSLRFPVFPGRGPVLKAVVYPLLAQGRLGRSLELLLFDPLALEPERVTLRVLGSETVQLPGGSRKGMHARVEGQGRVSDVWLDEDGMVLREETPSGLRADHERWSDHEPPESR
jgi:hypothetical protein